MKRVWTLIGLPAFQASLEEINKMEKKRKYCGHDLNHLMSVARIARILAFEDGLAIPADVLYGTALLHDIGKALQYRDGTPHQTASAAMAPALLRAAGFSDEEIPGMTEAIRAHRDSTVAGERTLRGILYRADKLSRACFNCPAREDCDWPEERKHPENLY